MLFCMPWHQIGCVAGAMVELRIIAGDRLSALYGTEGCSCRSVSESAGEDFPPIEMLN